MIEPDGPASGMPTLAGEPTPPSGAATMAGNSVVAGEADTIAGESTQPSAADGQFRRLQRGDQVGRYMVLDVLGRGGMGVVYTAYDPKLDRKIALKLRRPSPGADETAHLRLQREAQAIAQLSHPNVVSVHDVGTLGARVFIAMELVDGLDLRGWLQAEPRTHAEIIDCFVQAGRGLAAAHASGLVHRDFKPDNVLVGNDGRARVVDFGLVRNARWSETSFRDEEIESGRSRNHEISGVELTTAGSLLGTPAYMSPEQFSGQPGEAYSDQFSFCIALYEALYGERPFVGDTIASLSTAVIEGAIEPAPRGNSVSPRLRRVLLKGLAVKPSQRYPDMNTLLAELTAAIAPRRGRWALAGVVGLGGVVATAWAVIPEPPSCEPLIERARAAWTSARRDAMAERFLAVDRSFAADTWARVDDSVTTYIEDWSGMQGQACEGVLPEGAQECLDERLRSAAILLEMLDDADEGTVIRAVSLVRGLADLDACADEERLRERLVPNDPVLRDQVAAARDAITRVKFLHEHGRDDEAMKLLDATAQEASDVDYPPLRAELTALRGELVSSAGKLDESLSIYDEAFAQALESRHDRMAFEVCASLMFIHGVDRRERTEAERWARRANAFVHRLGDPQKLVLKIESAHASMLAQTGHYEEAKQKNNALIERARADGAEGALASLQNNGGSIAAGLREFDEAQRLFEESLAYTESIYGPDHPVVLRSQVNLAVIMIMSERSEAGAAVLEELVPRQEAALGLEHPELANSLEALGVVYSSLERYAESEAMRRRVLEIRSKLFGETAVPVLLSHLKIVVLMRQMGREAEMHEAVDTMMATLRLRTEPMPPDAQAQVLSQAVHSALLRGHIEPAYALATELHTLCAEQKGCGPDERAISVVSLGRAELLRGDIPAAIASLETALESIEALSTNDQAELRFALGRALLRADVVTDAQRQRSRTLLEQAVEGETQGGVTGNPLLQRIAAWRSANPG